MLCIHNIHTDPHFNLATEEYLLTEFTEDCFMLWRNGPSIIVGKNQNTNSEINIDYVQENGIKVVRRLSGGGAVFHDLGNINFTFIQNDTDSKELHFQKYTQPILEVLQKLGVSARFEGRNDLTIDGRKFSGNAEFIRKNRILHHGTLLFSAEMTDLTQALKVNPLKYQDKSVKSVRSRVTNISEHLPQPLSITEFIQTLMDHVTQKYPDAAMYDFTGTDIQRIRELVSNKYGTWEWNFGVSPKYSFKNVARVNGGNLEVLLDVQQGVILNARIYGDFFYRRDIAELEAALKNTPHDKTEIKQKLQPFNIDDYLANASLDEVVDALF